MKRYKSVERTIFLNLIIFVLNVYLKLTNQMYFLIKTPLFFTIHNKMGFCCNILSLNDLTPSPISRPGNHCLQWQWANARANLWWWHEPFPGEISIALRPCAGKVGVAKRSWRCLGIIPSNRCCQFSMHTAAHADHSSHSNSARELSRAIFARREVRRHVVPSICYTKLS